MSILGVEQIPEGRRNVFYFSLLYFFGSLVGLSFFTPREDFWLMMNLFIIAFIVLLYWIRMLNLSDERMIWALAIAARLVFLFSLPMLSDDYFRFIWDGRLLNMGENPLSNLPDVYQYMPDMAELYGGLNSKQYYSVYPPVMQGVFFVTSWIAGSNILLNVILLKLVLLLADVGVIYFAIKILRKLKLPVKNVIFYALNPLIIVEVVGNLHFEGLMMCFTLGAIYILIDNRVRHAGILAAFIFALGVSTKLASVLFLLPMLRWIGWKKTLLFATPVLFFVLISFLPFLSSEVISNFSNSLDLYFRTFEFNASIYFLANYGYAQMIGWEEIKYVGPIVALIGAILILFFSLRKRIDSGLQYFQIVLLVLTIHLAFSTTVHPWYLVNLVVASMFTKYRFVILWCMLIVVTYFYYQELQIPWVVLAIEYLIVGIYGLYELRSVPHQNNQKLLSNNLEKEVT